MTSGGIRMAQRLAKVRAMSPRELAERVTYKAVVSLERVQHRQGRLHRPGRLDRLLVDALQGPAWRSLLVESRRSRTTRWLPGAGAREAMRRLFEHEYRGELGDTLRHAEAAREHRFEFFGQVFQYGAEIDWQADPVTGRRWPAQFHADVPVHRGDVGYGDVKHVWELSRQQYLIDLAKSHYLTGSEADLLALKSLVRSWMAGNPYATGVNWACALEPAFRVLSWLWAYHLTSDSLDDEFHIEWLAAFHDHGRFLARHLEHYASPYNHLIGEATALYILGVCFPEFRAAGSWKAGGRQVLEGRLGDQFYADGGSVEQSAFYHHATVGFYLLSALTAQSIGEDLAPSIWRAIERGLEFSASLIQPDGRTPEIGGADDGKPIRMEHLPFWDFRPYQAVGAVLFARGDFKAVAGRFFEDALWLLGPAGREAFEALEAEPPAYTSVALESSGYYVMRTDWSSAGDYVCVDCGEQAAGMRSDGVPNSMHGHADCLSVVAWLAGRRVLVDAGLYAYNCGGEWEAHFRETAAHNTVRIDGRDQARHLGKMAWSHSYRARPEGWFTDGRQSWVLGSHDGYARGPDGMTHRRAVWLRPGGYLVIVDVLAGTGRHDVEVNFQFAPGSLDLPAHGRAVFDQAVEMCWTGAHDWRSRVRCGGPSPEDGWICPSLGVRVAAPRLTLAATVDTPAVTLLTVLAVGRPADTRLSVVDTGAAGTRLLTVRGDGYTDWIAAGPLSGGPLETDATVAVCRVLGGRTIEASRVGGTMLRADAAALTRLEDTATAGKGPAR
jgi:hypothetical protein